MITAQTPMPPLHRIRRSALLTWGVAVACAALAGCDAVIPRVTPELVGYAQRRDPAADLPGMEVARTLYVNRCNSCHSLNDPRAYDEQEWHTWMRKMARKAKLTSTQEAAMLVFVLAARETPPEKAQ
ncbi:MAG: hypothetical protein H0X38_13270 [Planctomycetes bacterium]|nr:hypothetical protein [Planctomycetota bacterium]